MQVRFLFSFLKPVKERLLYENVKEMGKKIFIWYILTLNKSQLMHTSEGWKRYLMEWKTNLFAGGHFVRRQAKQFLVNASNISTILQAYVLGVTYLQLIHKAFFVIFFPSWPCLSYSNSLKMRKRSFFVSRFRFQWLGSRHSLQIA